MTCNPSSANETPEVPVSGGSRVPALILLESYLLKALPGRFHSVVKRFCKTGKSKTDAIKLKCLECSCGQSGEVARCPVVECPLWPVRPFQREEFNREVLKGNAGKL